MPTASRTCGKCGVDFQARALVSIATPDDRMGSNTERELCPECVKKFKTWMAKKGYLKTDCWCGHIDEFRAVSDA